jgi:acyl-CoA synthetase (AMP-forming)/AMP-acid ligase II
MNEVLDEVAVVTAEPFTAPEMFTWRIEHDPDAVFLYSPDGTGMTYAAIAEAATSLALELRHAGVSAGDTVGLYLWNDPSWVVASLATWWLDCVVGVCGAVTPASEASRRFDLIQPKAIVAASGLESVGRRTIFVGAEGTPLQPNATVGVFERSSPTPESDACVFFTSGTTGEAKALIYSHEGLTDIPRSTVGAYSKSARFRPRVADADKPPVISFNPFGHIASFGRMLFRLYVGHTMVMVRRFDVATMKDVISRYPIDTLQLTPAMIYALAYTEIEMGLERLKYVTSGTAPLPMATRDAFEARYKVPILQVYGSTEGGITAQEHYDDVIAGRRGPGSVGRVVPGCEWGIVRPDGTDVERGEVGELVGRPEQVRTITSAGESNLPVDNDGWYHTGDLGRLDSSGVLYITGRLKEMLIVGGFNVYPAEVEDALRQSDLVRDAIVIGLEDERLGEIPVAGILWDSACSDAAEEHDRWRRLGLKLRESVEPYKVPRRWFSIEEIPLTPSGKPDRKEGTRLAAAMSEELSREER